MSNPLEQEKLAERQASVFGVLDIVTKPIQWLLGGIKLVALLLLLALVAISTPIYHYICGHGVSSKEIEIALLVLRWLVLLIAAPEYKAWGAITLFATLYFYFLFFPNGPRPSYEQLALVLLAFQIVGYLWVGVRLFNWQRDRQRQQKWKKEREAAKQEEIRKAQREFREERASTAREHKELVDQVAELVSSSGLQAVEMMRAAKVLAGETFQLISPEKVVLGDILRILNRLSEAKGEVTTAVARLYHGIQGRLEPSYELRVKDCIRLIQEHRSRHSAISIPVMVSLLGVYDTVQQTRLAAKAAAAYGAVVRAASHACGESVAVKIIANRYLEVFRPHISGEARDSDTAWSGDPNSGNGGKLPKCPKCVKAYQILDLSPDAGKDEVQRKRRAYAEFLHPDQLGHKSEQARRVAEEELKKINGACDQILQCKCSQPTRQGVGV
jgi:hypothetical protein